MNPSAHLFLKQPFLYYRGDRVFVEGGPAVRLDRGERAVVECLLRGESELGVLARSLAEMEVGGDPRELARRLVERYSAPASLIAIEPPRDVIDPEVIVCSFSTSLGRLDVRRLLRRLRRRFRVLHVGLAQHVRGDPRSNVNEASREEARGVPSAFRFVQWARSLIRCQSRAVLVLTGAQDLTLFGDLAATHQSLVSLGLEWPPATGIQDVLGGDALLSDPLPGLVALFHALRMTGMKDLDRISYATSSELAWLELYALRTARHVAYGMSDQPGELHRLGRPAEGCSPIYVGPRRRRRERPATGVLAVVLDLDCFQRGAPVLAALDRARERAGLRRTVLRSRNGWLDLVADDGLRAVPRTHGDAPEPEVAVLLPGLSRDLGPSLDTLREGVPTLCYPTLHPHPLLDGAAEPWVASCRTTEEWATAFGALRTEGSALRNTVLEYTRRLLEGWDLTRRIAELARSARTGDGDRRSDSGARPGPAHRSRSRRLASATHSGRATGGRGGRPDS